MSTQKKEEGDRILNNILEHIGGTPMVRINKIGKSEGIECEIGIQF
jgi:hypothetical protein